MRICLYLDRDRTFRWHHWLVDALTTSGHQVYVRFSPKRLALPKSYATLFATERIAYNLAKNNSAIDSIEPSVLPSDPGAEPFDALIRLAVDESLPAAKRTLTPCFNSMPTVFGAVAALLGHDPLRIEIHDSGRSVPLTAYPAIADHDVLASGMDNLLSFTVGMLIKTLVLPIVTEEPVGARMNRAPSVIGAAYMHAVNSVLGKAARYLKILTRGNRDWTIAWRRDSASLLDRGSARFRVLPNPKGHYYGDPFPFRVNGSDFVFVEDFDYARGYACISVARIGEQVTMRPVLDTGYHLSYPFVFEHADQIWMIPESGVVSDICLYRAVKFPYEWECEGVLLQNIEGYDTTLVLPQGTDQRFWLFVSEVMWNSTGWDACSLFHSDRLLGPWIPHEGGNPVVFDARYSRPAGAVFERNGQLIRPVQDCSRLYGGAVNLCQIDQLDNKVFRQSVIGTIQCAPASGLSPYLGCHTYNYRDGLEVIDIFDRGIGNEVTAYYRPIEQTQPVGSSREPVPPIGPVVVSA